MLAKVTFPNRRRRKRLDGGFEISFPDQAKGRTKMSVQMALLSK